MSLVDHTQSVVVPYNIDNTFQATKNAIYKLNDYKIDSFNEIMHTFNLKAGVSLWSWGENITLTLTENNNGETIINILSTPKTGIMFGGAMDMGKNRKNIQNLYNAISQELLSYPQINQQIQQNTKDNTKFCTQCGAQLSMDAKFCSNCGFKTN